LTSTWVSVERHGTPPSFIAPEALQIQIARSRTDIVLAGRARVLSAGAVRHAYPARSIAELRRVALASGSG